jgi:hypothetical protein
MFESAASFAYHKSGDYVLTGFDIADISIVIDHAATQASTASHFPHLTKLDDREPLGANGDGFAKRVLLDQRKLGSFDQLTNLM